MRAFLLLAFLSLPASAMAQICSTQIANSAGDTISGTVNWHFGRRSITTTLSGSGGETISPEIVARGVENFSYVAGSDDETVNEMLVSGNPSGWSCTISITSVVVPFNQSSWPVDEEGKAVFREQAADWGATAPMADYTARAWGAASLLGCGFPCGLVAFVFETISRGAVYQQGHFNDLALDPDDWDYCTPADFNRQSPDALGLSYSGDQANDALVDETTAIDAYLDQAYRSANKMNTAARDGSGCFSDRQYDTMNAIYGAGVEIQNYGYWAGIAADEIDALDIGADWESSTLRDLRDRLYNSGDQLKGR